MAENRVKITITADGSSAESAIKKLNTKLADTTAQSAKTKTGVQNLGTAISSKLVTSLSSAATGSELACGGFADVDTSSRALATQLGLTGTQFNTLYSRMLDTQAHQQQEDALRDIASAANLSDAEIRELGAQLGLSESAVESIADQFKTAEVRIETLSDAAGNEMVSALKKLDSAAGVAEVGVDSLDDEAKKLAVQFGLTEAEAAELQTRMAKTSALKTQEAALKDIASSADLTKSEIKMLGVQMGLSESTIKNVTTKPPESLSTSMFSMGNIAKTAIAYFGVSELIQFGQAVFDTGLQVDTMERSFAAVFGTAEQVDIEFQFLHDTADRLGQNFYELGDSYKQVSASAKDTALEGQGVRDVFSAVTEASAALGLSSDSTAGALNAISQMMSKGTVQAEELKGQLGERLPGAFNLAAKAMGVSTAELQKMLEKGEVLAEDLLPKLATELHNTYGAAAETAGMESAQAATNNLSEAWTTLKANLFDSESAVAGIKAITDVLDTLNDYASLRSVTETLAEGAGLAKEGLLDWQEFLNASFIERQKMVDKVLAYEQEKEAERYRYKVDWNAKHEAADDEYWSSRSEVISESTTIFEKSLQRKGELLTQWEKTQLRPQKKPKRTGSRQSRPPRKKETAAQAAALRRNSKQPSSRARPGLRPRKRRSRKKRICSTSTPTSMRR